MEKGKTVRKLQKQEKINREKEGWTQICKHKNQKKTKRRGKTPGMKEIKKVTRKDTPPHCVGALEVVLMF